ncbi:MAG: Unknown protein [uncultured Sulfurovum sp.]|uniref:Thioredoxin domain-containing protein n=1 Tax=uncultured Sulfurovum sp. TaxID=269237 RepID=A0A6S6TES4_9BACT|nr:MAG: Unknown protein [uncultured Sulfurovum sp.]
MKKTLLVSSLLLIGLSHNACVKNDMNLPSSPQAYEQPITVTPEPINHPTSTPPSSTLGETHQLKTVQGPIISIQETSNGFIFPQYQDKIVLLQIFGKECEYCFEEMPFIQGLARKYGEKVNIISLQAQKQMTPSVAQSIIQRFNLNHPIIDRREASNLLLFISSSYGWNGVLPYTLIVKNGVTEYSFSGESDHQEFEEAIRGLL